MPRPARPTSTLRLATFAWILVVPALAVAQSEEPPSPSSEPQSIAIAISGGASIGAYEAGYLHLLERILAENPQHARLRIATGTSAGSINALLALMASCMPPALTPEQSAFYSTWTRSTFANLYVPEDVQPLGMFSRDVLHAIWDEREPEFEHALAPTCDVVLGIPVTRLDAYRTQLVGSLESLPRSEETFVVRIRGDAATNEARLDNYVDRQHAILPALLPIDGTQVHELRSVRDAAFSSASFPLAFTPTTLGLCVGSGTCTPELATPVRMIDGGVLDNTPLRLAVTIARTGLADPTAADGTPAFRDEPEATLREIPPNTHFLLLDPDVTAYPQLPEEPESREGALEVYLDAASNVLASARARELSTLFENYPEMARQVHAAHVYLPPTAGLIDGFFGLFDAQFLAFDFALGMAEAQREFDRLLAEPLRQASGSALEFTSPELDHTSHAVRTSRCISDVLAGRSEARTSCAGDALGPDRMLLQLALERLYAHCRLLPPGTPTNHDHCRRAIAGEDSPIVPFVDERSVREHAIRDPESVREAVDLLGALGFVFRDLGLERGESSQALLAMRQRLADMGGRFVHAQPGSRQLLDAAIHLIANEIAYTPPRAIGHVLVGRHIELGLSLGAPYSRVRWLRATAALAIVGLETIVASDAPRMAFGGALGLEVEPIGLSNSLYQLRVGARVGYSIGTVDRAGREACPANHMTRFCTRPYVDTYVAGALLELIRIQLSAHFYPTWGEGRRFEFFIGPSIGVELRSRR